MIQVKCQRRRRFVASGLLRSRTPCAPARSQGHDPHDRAVVPCAMADVTFRDFAAATMKGDVEAAGVVLETLLELPAAEARAAAQHFQRQSTALGPAFMG